MQQTSIIVLVEMRQSISRSGHRSVSALASGWMQKTDPAARPVLVRELRDPHFKLICILYTHSVSEYSNLDRMGRILYYDLQIWTGSSHPVLGCSIPGRRE